MAIRHGLHLLYAGEDPVVDIVFVHGLFGHPEDTWTWTGPAAKDTLTPPSQTGADALRSPSPAGQKTKRRFWRFGRTESGRDHEAQQDDGSGTASRPSTAQSSSHHKNTSVFWPKVLLPQAIPQSRIFTWGYDADISHLFSPASQSTVFQHAASLLSDLADNRISDNDKSLPIIFVAHSLGGIVVKDMLNASRAEVTYLKEILPATHGIIFLGTPHRGSATATMGKIAQNITKVLGNNPNTSILHDLEVNSETLDRIGRGFHQILAERPIQVQSFREELPTKGIMVVNQFSSTIEHGMEVVSNIPANHSDMVKFSCATDVGFVRVKAVLNRWVTSVTAQKRQDGQHDMVDLIGQSRLEKKDPTDLLKLQAEISKQLTPSSFEIEMAQNYDRCPGTGTWLLEDEDFRRFVNNSTSATMLLAGGPGSGKTFLASLLVDHLRKQFDSSQETSLSYFFCDSKTEDSSKRTTLSIVKTLIAQLLGQISQRDPDFVKDRLAALFNVRQEAKKVSGLFYLSLENCLEKFKLNYIVIDALNECDDWREILTTFTRLPDSVRSKLKLVFSSQSTAGIPYSVQQIPVQTFSRVDIDQESMESDITRYLRWRIQSLDIRSLGTHEEAMKLLTKGSQGLFILARLKLDILETEILPYSVDVKKAVEELPEGIFSYYERSLSRLSPEHLNMARRMFEWVIYSQAPLNVRELGVACVDKFELSSHEQPKALTIRGIENFGAGLIEIFDDRVRLIHSTVKEFLVSFDWDKARESNVEYHDDSIHANLVVKCIEYLSMPLLVSDTSPAAGVSPLLANKFPFLTYAAHHWISHLQLTSSTDESLKKRVLQFLDCEAGLAWWVQYTSLVDDDNWWSLPRLTSTWFDWLNRQSVSFDVRKYQIELITRLCQQHLTLFEDASSNVDIPNYIRALLRLSEMKFQSLETLQAEKLCRRALRESEKLNGLSHGLWRCRILLNLGSMLRITGKHSEALSLAHEILASPEMSDKANFRVFLSVLQLEGEARYDMRHLVISERILRAGFDHAQQLMDKNDPDLLGIRNSLALTLIELDRLQEARSLLDITYFEVAIGKDHPSTLTAMENFAVILEYEGKYQKASDMARRIWKLRQAIDTPRSDRSVSTCLSLSRALHTQGNLNEAHELSKNLLSQVVNTVGPDHYLALQVEGHLASVLFSQMSLDMALSHNQHVVAEKTRQLGADHWQTICEKSLTASIYERQERYGEAETIRLEALDRVRRDPDMTYIDHCTMMTSLARLRNLQSRSEEARSLQLEVIKVLQQHEAHNSLRMLFARDFLGYLESYICNYMEAEQLHSTVLEEFEARFDQDSPSTLRTMSRLALAKRNLGKPNEAMKLHERILAGYRKFEDEHSPNCLQTLRDMAATKRRQEKWVEAEQLLESALAALQLKREDQITILATMEELAVIKRSRGELQDARRICEQVLEGCLLQNRDPGNARVLSVQHELSIVLEEMENLTEAEELIRKTIAAHERNPRPDMASMLSAKDSLAHIIHDQGKLQEAAELQTWIVEKRRELYRDKHPDILTSITNLAVTRIDQGKMEEAERLYTQVVDVYRQEDNCGGNPTIARALMDLAWTKAKMRKLLQARDVQQAALDMFRGCLDEESSSVLKAISRLGMIKAQLGEVEEAEALQSHVVDRYRTLNDPATLASRLGDLAWTKGMLEKYTEAKDLSQEAYNLYKSAYGENSRVTLIAKGSLAGYMSRLRELDEAKRFLTEVLEKLNHLETDRAHDTLLTQAELADVLKELGEFSEAERVQEEVVNLRKKSSDEGNFEVLRAMTQLAHIKHCAGKFEDEEALFEDVLMYCRQIEGGDVNTLVTAIDNLALVKRDLYKIEEAEKLEEESIALLTELNSAGL